MNRAISGAINNIGVALKRGSTDRSGRLYFFKLDGKMEVWIGLDRIITIETRVALSDLIFSVLLYPAKYPANVSFRTRIRTVRGIRCEVSLFSPARFSRAALFAKCFIELSLCRPRFFPLARQTSDSRLSLRFILIRCRSRKTRVQSRHEIRSNYR